MSDPTRKPYRLFTGPYRYRRDYSRVPPPPPPGFFRRLWAWLWAWLTRAVFG